MVLSASTKLANDDFYINSRLWSVLIKEYQDLAIFKKDNVMPMFAYKQSDCSADSIVKKILNQFNICDNRDNNDK